MKLREASRNKTFLALMRITGRHWRMFALLAIFSSCTLRAQVPVAPLQVTRLQVNNSTGQPLAAGCMNFFAAGTSTPQAIYADNTGTIQLPNPLTLDAAGEADVWLTNTAYRIVANTGVPGQLCSTALGSQLWVTDNKNIYAIINQGGNFVVANATFDPPGVSGELNYRTDIPCFRGFTTFWDCFVETTLLQTLTNKTIAASANTLKCVPDVAGQYLRDNATQLACSPLIESDNISTFPNEAVIGTALNNLAQLTGVGTVNKPPTTATQGVIGVCVGTNCGTVGSASISSIGILNCVFDGATSANDYVQISSTNSGQCHDSGPSFPTTGQVLGRVLSTNGVAGTYQTVFFGPGIAANLQTPQTTVYSVYPSETVTGTTINLLTKLTGAPSKAIVSAAGDTSGAIGICAATCGISGTSQITTVGQATCVFDGATTAGDYVQISATTTGNCHDAGASFPGSNQVLGRVLTTNAAGGAYNMTLFGTEVRGATPTVTISQFTNKNLAGGVALTGGVLATVDSIATTMPASGGPWRVNVCYAYGNQASSGLTGEAFVTDATNFFANSFQFTSAGGGGYAACGWSPVTYTNNAPVTFTVKAQNTGNQNITTTTAVTGQASHMAVTIVSSN